MAEQPATLHQKQTRSRSRVLPPGLMYTMRGSMPYFVSALRVVDEWKRQNAKRADAITQAEYDVSAKYVKSTLARSLLIEDLLRFVDDTVLDIDFMVQLPSIEKCLEQWWQTYARENKCIDQDVLRTVYYDLATVLVEAKTENTHKNSVSMIARGGWTKWSTKEPPLTKPEFFRLLFILTHLMTTSSRLNDYVVFLQETMSKLTRVRQSKATRTAMREHRQPKSRRKLSVSEIMAGAHGGPIVVLPSPSSSQMPRLSALNGVSNPLRVGSVGEGIKTSREGVEDESSTVWDVDDGMDETPDQFVEILARSSRCQHIVIDPLLHERQFQEKWHQASRTPEKSLNELVAERNPVTSKFAPPMMINRLRSARSPLDLGSWGGSGAKSTGALLTIDQSHGSVEFSASEDEILRRSLSRVTLKERVTRNKAAAAAGHANHANNSPKGNNEPLYLAIST